MKDEKNKPAELVKMTATHAINWKGKRYAAGDEFEATAKDGANLQRALMATPATAAAAKQVGPVEAVPAGDEGIDGEVRPPAKKGRNAKPIG